MNSFNAYDDNLQFTYEIENNNQLNFLDMTLIRNNDKISTNWCQKPTSSGRILNFNSNHHIQLKKNLIYNLIDRAILLSDKKFHNNNIQKVRKILLNNDFERSFIDNCIKHRLRKIRFNLPPKITHNENRFSIVVPYNDHMFNLLKKLFKPYMISIIPTYNKTFKNIIRKR